jgi:hypothetical protein
MLEPFLNGRILVNCGIGKECLTLPRLVKQFQSLDTHDGQGIPWRHELIERHVALEPLDQDSLPPIPIPQQPAPRSGKSPSSKRKQNSSTNCILITKRLLPSIRSLRNGRIYLPGARL